MQSRACPFPTRDSMGGSKAPLTVLALAPLPALPLTRAHPGKSSWSPALTWEHIPADFTPRLTVRCKGSLI